MHLNLLLAWTLTAAASFSRLAKLDHCTLRSSWLWWWWCFCKNCILKLYSDCVQGPTGNWYPPATRHLFRSPTQFGWPVILGIIQYLAYIPFHFWIFHFGSFNAEMGRRGITTWSPAEFRLWALVMGQGICCSANFLLGVSRYDIFRLQRRLSVTKCLQLLILIRFCV